MGLIDFEKREVKERRMRLFLPSSMWCAIIAAVASFGSTAVASPLGESEEGVVDLLVDEEEPATATALVEEDQAAVIDVSENNAVEEENEPEDGTWFFLDLESATALEGEEDEALDEEATVNYHMEKGNWLVLETLPALVEGGTEENATTAVEEGSLEAAANTVYRYEKSQFKMKGAVRSDVGLKNFKKKCPRALVDAAKAPPIRSSSSANTVKNRIKCAEVKRTSSGCTKPQGSSFQRYDCFETVVKIEGPQACDLMLRIAPTVPDQRFRRKLNDPYGIESRNWYFRENPKCKRKTITVPGGSSYCARYRNRKKCQKEPLRRCKWRKWSNGYKECVAK